MSYDPYKGIQMLSEDDLLFTRTNHKSIPQWYVSIGGKQIAEVTERTVLHPPYRVSISGMEDTHLLSRKEVIRFILIVVNL